MKKFLSILSAGAIAALTVPAIVSAEAPTIPDELYYNCDFSGNGEIDYMDAQMLLVYYAEIAVGHESDEPYMNAEVREKIAKYGDVYDDGVDGGINAADAGVLLTEIRRRGDRWTIRADFNNDGLINTEDVYLLLAPIVAEKGTVDLTFYGENEPFYTTSSIAEGYEEVLDEILKNGDIDCNGVIDETDVSALLDWRYFYHGHDAGDINCDGAVDAVDASAVLTYYAKMSTKPETVTVPEELAFMFSGDYNSDGVVDALDASAILTYYANSSVQS